MNNDELYHYGVKGMRWGQRKAILKTEYKARVAKAYGDRDKIAKAKADYKTKLAKEKEAYKNTPEGQKTEARKRAGKTAAVAGAAATGGALAAIGATAAVLLPAMPVVAVGYGLLKGFIES